ncbi:MAG: cupin domain-containing protein [Acidobacteriota bacterium]|nr:cupin domain-containing protein [Acidobacteriota bacterium]
MNRRDFSALLTTLLASPALLPSTEAHAAATPNSDAPADIPRLISGSYPLIQNSPKPGATRISHRYLLGMLPDSIRLEAHLTVLSPGAPPEPIWHHKHSEMWLMREGTCTLTTAGTSRTLRAGDMGLCIAGDDHYISNASNSEPASYFVVAVGPPE